MKFLKFSWTSFIYSPWLVGTIESFGVLKSIMVRYLSTGDSLRTKSYRRYLPTEEIDCRNDVKRWAVKIYNNPTRVSIIFQHVAEKSKENFWTN